ncbi:MAG: Mur ligase domain-containing protein [Flavobacteriales bacterium]|nr:Mur ligase domain-containing protein [Flavobacteriales bacterium]
MNIHFIAIGGAAMHNLALALHKAGHQVTGSDDEIFDPARTRLQKAGLLPQSEGWFPEKIHEQIDAIVLGMHAKSDNPELKKARELGLKVYSYPEYLYEVWKNKTRVVIGGSHGKTSITSMILHAYNACGVKSDYMVGALLAGFENMVSIDDSNEIAVMEGDEYLASTLDLRPKFHLYKGNIGVISGIAWDHINVFPTFENYVEQFSLFIDSLEPEAYLIYNAEDPEVKKLCEQHTRTDIRKIPYVSPDYSVKDEKFTVQFDGKMYPLQVFGKHNLSNLSAACEVCKLTGISAHDFWNASRQFAGASNRLELLAEGKNGVCYKDFAHSPSKVQATLAAFMERYAERKVTACFELHTFSTLNKDFLPGYQGALHGAHRAAVFYNPHTLELKRMPPLDAEFVRTCFGRPDLEVITDTGDLEKFILNSFGEKTALLLMSSGNWGNLNTRKLAEDSVRMLK